MKKQIYSELADMKIMMMQSDHLFDSVRIQENVKIKLEKLYSKYLSNSNDV